MSVAPETEDELLEVIDADGRVLELRPRRELHGNPALRHRAIHIVVRNATGAVFLQKRSLRKRIQPGRWDTAVGGHVDPRETWEQAATRELIEELGVSGVSLEPILEYEWRTDVETERVCSFSLMHEGPFVLNPEEIDEGRFFALEELPELAASGTCTPNLVHELGLLGLLA